MMGIMTKEPFLHRDINCVKVVQEGWHLWKIIPKEPYLKMAFLHQIFNISYQRLNRFINELSYSISEIGRIPVW